MNAIEIRTGWNTVEVIETEGITADLYDRFIRYLDVSEKTVQTYTRSLRQFAKWCDVNEVSCPTREDILAYRSYLEIDHKPATIQAYMIAVRLFFQWLESEHIYPNVADRVKGASVSKEHKKDYLTSRQVKKVLDGARKESVEGLRNYAMLALMFTGALRTIEVSRANVKDVRALGDDTVIFIQGKGEMEAAVPVRILPEVEDALNAYLAARGSHEPDEPLFVSESNNSKGKRLSTRSVSGIVKKAMQTAGYDSERWTAHSTRHTAITLARLGGEDIEKVQQFARHKSVSTTMIYDHAIERQKNTCSQTVGKAIF